MASFSSEYKRARHEIKKKSSDTLKLQKKARKGKDLRVLKEHWAALRE